MLETPHVFIGAAIASKIPNPLISLPLALASHFILEKVPHWNPHLNQETEKYGRPTKKSTLITAIDSATALISGSLIAFQALPNTAHFFTILTACFLSALPDLVEAPYFFLGWRNKIMAKWIKWQKSIQIDTSPALGLLTQILTILAALWWII
jgi:hypothetical protein